MSTSTEVVDPQAAAGGMPFDEAPRKSRLAVAEGVATIGVTGVLLKRVPNLVRWFGVEATSYAEIRQDLAQALGDEQVKTIRLRIESPGGMVAGVKEAADAIYDAAAKKGVKAHIEDLGASAAMWLATQADEITANPNASVGSLGAYTAYADFSKAAEQEGIKVHVISSGPHKGMGVPGAPITEQQLAAVQGLIDGIAGSFQADVARGRGMDMAKTKELMTGRVWRAEEAVQIGLIDGIRSTTNSGITSPGGPAAALSQEESMTTEEKAAAEKATREAGAQAERERSNAITAEFADDPGFALAQIKAGATLEQARGAYAAVLKERLAKKEQELVEAKAAKPAAAPAARPAGVAPVLGGEGGAGPASGPDFLAAAQQYAADHDCSVTEAMQKLARGTNGQRNSAVFERHVQSCLETGKAKAGV